MKRILAHDLDESPVFQEEPMHSVVSSRAVEPVKSAHFIDEDALADDRTPKFKGKDGRVFPVSRHHFSNR